MSEFMNAIETFVENQRDAASPQHQLKVDKILASLNEAEAEALESVLRTLDKNDMFSIGNGAVAEFLQGQGHDVSHNAVSNWRKKYVPEAKRIQKTGVKNKESEVVAKPQTESESKTHFATAIVSS